MWIEYMQTYKHHAYKKKSHVFVDMVSTWIQTWIHTSTLTGSFTDARGPNKSVTAFSVLQ